MHDAGTRRASSTPLPLRYSPIPSARSRAGSTCSITSTLARLPTVLSVAAAVHEAYAYKKADKELIKQYRFMQRIFSAAQRRLTICKAVGEQRQILRTLGEAALAEHAEWTLMHRERPLEHSRI